MDGFSTSYHRIGYMAKSYRAFGLHFRRRMFWYIFNHFYAARRKLPNSVK